MSGAPGTPPGDCFAGTYAQARRKFLDAARDAGLAVESHLHPLKGREGEDLAMDVVRDGPADAGCLLLVTSACHGAEGFCGSGVQVAALRDAAWRAQARARGVAVLYVHGLNPWGFSHLRRVTHENVDLNRNFPGGWRQEHEQGGAGPYPASEPEVRAMVDFIAKLARPVIWLLGVSMGLTHPGWIHLLRLAGFTANTPRPLAEGQFGPPVPPRWRWRPVRRQAEPQREARPAPPSGSAFAALADLVR